MRTLTDYYQRQNVLNRSREILISPLPNNDLAEALDQQMLQLSLSEEQSLPACFQYEYSKELLESRAEVKIRNLQLTQLRTRVRMDQQIAKLQEEVTNRIETPTTTSEAQKLYRQAISKIKENQRDHSTLRQEHLENIISNLEGKKEQESRSLLQRIKHNRAIEKIILCFRRIRSRRTISMQQPVNQLRVPKKDDNPKAIEKDATKWKLLVSPKEIIQALITRNVEHFSRTAGTPFTTDPLQAIFGYTTQDFWTKIKDQQQTIQNLHSATSAFLNQVQTETLDSEISETVTMKQL